MRLLFFWEQYSFFCAWVEVEGVPALYTLPKTNIAPENRPSRKENSSSNQHPVCQSNQPGFLIPSQVKWPPTRGWNGHFESHLRFLASITIFSHWNFTSPRYKPSTTNHQNLQDFRHKPLNTGRYFGVIEKISGGYGSRSNGLGVYDQFLWSSTKVFCMLRGDVLCIPPQN